MIPAVVDALAKISCAQNKICPPCVGGNIPTAAVHLPVMPERFITRMTETLVPDIAAKWRVDAAICLLLARGLPDVDKGGRSITRARRYSLTQVRATWALRKKPNDHERQREADTQRSADDQRDRKKQI
jgi:hypothetical protein